MIVRVRVGCHLENIYTYNKRCRNFHTKCFHLAVFESWGLVHWWDDGVEGLKGIVWTRIISSRLDSCRLDSTLLVQFLAVHQVAPVG